MSENREVRQDVQTAMDSVAGWRAKVCAAFMVLGERFGPLTLQEIEEALTRRGFQNRIMHAQLALAGGVDRAVANIDEHGEYDRAQTKEKVAVEAEERRVQAEVNAAAAVVKQAEREVAAAQKKAAKEAAVKAAKASRIAAAKKRRVSKAKPKKATTE